MEIPHEFVLNYQNVLFDIKFGKNIKNKPYLLYDEIHINNSRKN